MIKTRLEWVEYFLAMAKMCAHQATCMRRRYGAVVVGKDKTIISTGYNGAPSGQCDCLQNNKCWRRENNVPSGSMYEKCLSVHAEMNALIQAGKMANTGTLYLCGVDADNGDYINAKPCFICAKLIVNAGIELVVCRTEKEGFVFYNPLDIYKDYSEKIGL